MSITNLSKEDSLKLLKSLLNTIRKDIDQDELVKVMLDTLAEQSYIPLSIFSGKLSPAESLCLYLKKEKGWQTKKIALFLKKDERTIWHNCKRAEKKGKLKIDTKILIPLSIFQSKRSVLENIIFHLIKEGHSYQEISNLLNKKYTTITTVYYRAKKNE